MAEGKLSSIKDLISIDHDTQSENYKQGSLFGLDSVVSNLKEAISSVKKDERNGETQPILIFGLPGTGKTHLVHTVTSETDVKLFLFNVFMVGSRIYRAQHGVQGIIKSVFQVARENTPCVLCFEDVETFCKQDEIYQQGKREFIYQIKSKEYRGVCLIAESQKPWLIDPDIGDLFSVQLHVNLPKQDARVQMLRNLLKDVDHDLTENDNEEFAKQMEGMTGSDIVCLLKDACMKQVRKLTEATHFKKIQVPITKVSKTLQSTEDEDKEVDEQSESTTSMTEEKLTPCKPDDENSICISVFDVPEEKLHCPSINRTDMLAVIQASHSSATDEEIEKMFTFSEDHDN